MKTRIYISIPITGHDYAEQKRKAKLAKEYFTKFHNYEVITPFELCPPTEDYNIAMGYDIAGLLTCNLMFLMGNWTMSKGCRAEQAIANIYGIKQMTEEEYTASHGISFEQLATNFLNSK
jgi:hypothetical protein